MSYVRRYALDPLKENETTGDDMEELFSEEDSARLLGKGKKRRTVFDSEIDIERHSDDGGERNEMAFDGMPGNRRAKSRPSTGRSTRGSINLKIP